MQEKILLIFLSIICAIIYDFYFRSELIALACKAKLAGRGKKKQLLKSLAP